MQKIGGWKAAKNALPIQDLGDGRYSVVVMTQLQVSPYSHSRSRVIFSVETAYGPSPWEIVDATLFAISGVYGHNGAIDIGIENGVLSENAQWLNVALSFFQNSSNNPAYYAPLEMNYIVIESSTKVASDICG